jgi:hypothetical protein
MKLLIMSLAMLFNASSVLACECADENWVDEAPVVERLLKKSIAQDIEIKKDQRGNHETVWLKAYPTLLDRLSLTLDGMEGSSCEVRGPNNEALAMCMPKIKSDYRYSLTMADGTACTADVGLVTTKKKVKAKLIATTCR